MRKYTEDILREAIESNTSFAGVLRSLGCKQSGGMHAHIRELVKNLGINKDHFLGQAHNRGKSLPKKSATDILVLGNPDDAYAKTYQLRRALLEIGREHKCECCGCEPLWKQLPLVLEIDHKNGLKFDNRKENLRFICPNCHSQSDNYGVKNVSTLVA